MLCMESSACRMLEWWRESLISKQTGKCQSRVVFPTSWGSAAQTCLSWNRKKRNSNRICLGIAHWRRMQRAYWRCVGDGEDHEESSVASKISESVTNFSS